ncbi:MAG: AAA family ATPase [Propionibacteriaceae bacterium]|jgi:predicted AAA+ superfamily ATPase|nr:AAA family ATPase [Propionibacteriaceae bacterium]
MERKISQALLAWKNGTLPGTLRQGRMPVLLNGARQVGKTWAALDFGKAHYANTTYVNLETSQDAARVFAGELEPRRIVTELAALTGRSIEEGQTLLVLDEIQSSQRALTSLKYFAESGLDYHVLAAGSLLGMAVNRQDVSFPVGKVHQLQMHPLDFEEFLWARGRGELASLIRESFQDCRPLSPHENALGVFREYLAVGGMPQVVADYCARQDFNYVLALLQQVDNAFVADMAKYVEPVETNRIRAVWRAVASQLAHENRRFQYKTIMPGARAHTYSTALDWLDAAGLIVRCELVEAGRAPLAAHAVPATAKLYLLDTGLLLAKLSVPPVRVVGSLERLGGWTGALLENAVADALAAAGVPCHFWASKGTAEVDFVAQDTEVRAIPIEVKASTHTRSKSLGRFAQLYHPPYSIRVSAKNIGFENDILSVPFYAAFLLGERLGW